MQVTYLSISVLSCELQHMNGKSLPVQMKKEMDTGEKVNKNTGVIYFCPCSDKSPKFRNETKNVRLYKL